MIWAREVSFGWSLKEPEPKKRFTSRELSGW